MAVTITINIDGVPIEKEISLTQAGKILAFLGTEEGSVGGADVASYNQPPQQVLGDTIGHKQSVRELIDGASATTNPQKIVVMGNHIANNDPTGLFTGEAVRALFPKLREKVPRNFGRDLEAAVKQGWIEGDPDQKGFYFVTRSGEAKLAEGFGSARSSRKKRSNASKGSRSTSISTAKVRQEVLDLKNIVPELSGVPNYHKLPTKGFKVLWILAYGLKNNLDSLNPTEIAYLATKLRDKIEARDVNGLTTNAHKNGWITKDGSNYILLQKGEDELERLDTSEKED